MAPPSVPEPMGPGEAPSSCSLRVWLASLQDAEMTGESLTGGVASLNHRLIAATLTGSVA